MAAILLIILVLIGIAAFLGWLARWILGVAFILLLLLFISQTLAGRGNQGLSLARPISPVIAINENPVQPDVGQGFLL